MRDPSRGRPRSKTAKVAVDILGHARILLDTTRRMRAILAEPALSEFAEFVGRHELSADLDSLDRIARSMREDVDRYLKRR